MNLFDLSLLNWFNSWVGVSVAADGAVVFIAAFLQPLVIAGVMLFVVASLLPSFRHLKRKNIELFVFSLLSGVVARFVVTSGIRLFYNRPRPFEIIESVYKLTYQDAGHAFPSGHASFSFAIAAAVAFYYPKTGIIFFAAAILISIARVIAGIHWPTDIIAGAIVGVATAWVLHLLKEKFMIKNPKS